MENSLKSSSSYTKDLFGFKESSPSPSSSSTGIFASIFPPLPGAAEKNLGIEFAGTTQKQPLENQVWASKQGTPDNKHGKEARANAFNNEKSMFQEGVEPCPLSSSLYYGGPEDMYIHSSSPYPSGSHPIIKRDGKEDPNGNDPHSASRGNWWQGSLYY